MLDYHLTEIYDSVVYKASLKVLSNEGYMEKSPGMHSDILSRVEFQLLPREIHYLYWYIQGSIMNPETRKALRKAWGFCERHAWAAMLVELAFRPSFLHGPAMLYEDILARAVPAFDVPSPLQSLRLGAKLRDKGPCLMCEMDYSQGAESWARHDIIGVGGDPSHLCAFALRTKKYWMKMVCGRCIDN